MVSSLPVAYARTPGNLSGTGTFYDTVVSIVSIQMVGANQVIKDEGLGKVTGVLTGTYGFMATITIAPDGAATYVAVDACKCTVGGKTGGLVFSEQGSGNVVTGTFKSQALITKSSEDLQGLTGAALLQGIQDPLTLLTKGTYTITLSLPLNRQTSGAPYSIQASTSVPSLTPDGAKSPSPSSSQTTAAPQTNSAGASVSHPIALNPAPVSSHSQDRHDSDKQVPQAPPATSSSHVHHSHPHRSP